MEISKGMGDHDPVEKEDSTEYSVETPLTAHYHSDAASLVVPPHSMTPTPPAAAITAEPIPVAPTSLAPELVAPVIQDPTPTKIPATAEASASPLMHPATELLIGVSSTVYNLHTFIAEEVQGVIDHVNTEVHKVHSLLDQLDFSVKQLQSALSPPAIVVAPIFVAAPTSTVDPAKPTSTLDV